MIEAINFYHEYLNSLHKKLDNSLNAIFLYFKEFKHILMKLEL